MAPFARATPADQVCAMLAQHDFRGLKTLLQSWPAPDLACLTTQQPEKQLLVLFRLLPLAQVAAVFGYLASRLIGGLHAAVATQKGRFRPGYVLRCLRGHAGGGYGIG